MVNSECLQYFTTWKAEGAWGFISHFISLLKIVYTRTLLYILLLYIQFGCFYSFCFVLVFALFLFCCITAFRVYFISSSGEKARNCTPTCGRKGQWDAFLKSWEVFYAEKRDASISLPTFSPHPCRCVRHHFGGSISPKLLCATTSPNLDFL